MNSQIKVGIVTLYYNNYNFGGLLQSYALPYVLENVYHLNAEQITYMLHQDDVLNVGDNKAEKKTVFQIGYQVLVNIICKLEESKLIQRKKVFDTFIQEIPHSSNVYTDQNITETLDEYSVFVCGGDQIWNDYSVSWISREDSQVFTLGFVPMNIAKFSYSPSMAILSMTDDFKHLLQMNLRAFTAISVREKQSVDYIQPLVERTVNVVVDPVLLLTREEWNDFAVRKYNKEKYILCYFLSESTEYRKQAKRFANKMRYKLLTFPYILTGMVMKYDFVFGDIRCFDAGPREFVGLIQNAELILTDSYHACLLSMIFEKEFIVLERDTNGKTGNMNSRIHGFLNEYKIDGRICTCDSLMNYQRQNIDYENAKIVLSRRRAESFDYLNKTIQQIVGE